MILKSTETCLSRSLKKLLVILGQVKTWKESLYTTLPPWKRICEWLQITLRYILHINETYDYQVQIADNIRSESVLLCLSVHFKFTENTVIRALAWSSTLCPTFTIALISHSHAWPLKLRILLVQSQTSLSSRQNVTTVILAMFSGRPLWPKTAWHGKYCSGE